MQQERPISYHTVTLGPMTREGDTLAEICEQDPSGERRISTLHVPAGLPGEHVTIAVESPGSPPVGRRKRRWKPRPPRVWISEIHQPSPLRTQAPCPVFGTCGGCQLQHMRYDAQLEWKWSIVRHMLQDIGGFPDPPLLATVPCDNPWQYRNHMRFSVNREGQPGLTARGTHRVLPLTSCPIAQPYINRALSVLSKVNNARPQLLIRCGAATGQLLIQPHPTPDIAQQLADADLDLHTDTMEEVLANQTFRIRPSSFFQTNTAQAEKMAQMILNGLLNDTIKPSVGADSLFPPPIHRPAATLTPLPYQSPTHHNRPITIADAYCGVGTFAALLARHVSKVIAIEESASAIKDAQWNLRNMSNVEILKGKTEDLLPTLAEQLDGLVLDPPRAGCQQVVLDTLVQHPIKRIVYVSCDPSTLARDLHILCRTGVTHHAPAYNLCSVQPLDMFPQTAHIECVAVLERNDL